MKKLHPAVKAIIQQGEKFLVIKQEFSDNVVWDFPCDKVDFSENPYETLKREVIEEIQRWARKHEVTFRFAMNTRF